MANDRVFIKCKFCGGWRMLLKFFPPTGSKTGDNNILDFLNAHAICHPRRCEIDLGGDPGFELFTEADELDMEYQNVIPSDKTQRVRLKNPTQIGTIKHYGHSKML